jgi:hypothetical protein
LEYLFESGRFNELSLSGGSDFAYQGVMIDMSGHHPRTFDEISRSLDEFALSDDMLLDPRIMRQHSGNWVAVHRGKVIAVAPTLEAIRTQLHLEAVPLATVAIRFIGKAGMAAA